MDNTSYSCTFIDHKSADMDYFWISKQYHQRLFRSRLRFNKLAYFNIRFVFSNTCVGRLCNYEVWVEGDYYNLFVK